MKAKVNNLIARYERKIASIKADPWHSDMQYTQLVMMQGFVYDLKELTK